MMTENPVSGNDAGHGPLLAALADGLVRGRGLFGAALAGGGMKATWFVVDSFFRSTPVSSAM
jgi:hypothetical protein